MFIAKTVRQVKRLMIAVIGFTVLAIGLALIVLPGPAILVIPAGLAILSIEFAWARNLLKRMKEKLSRKHGTTHPDDTIDR
jgi:tellurite resistance protein TerC